MTELERVTERVCRLGHPDSEGTPIPLLSVDEFFSGNDVVGSIGCNLPTVPAPAAFERLFRSFLERPEVKDVRVQITAFDDPDWPFSDTVYVMTSASPQEVAAWFPRDLAPDDTWSGFSEARYEPYDVPPGVQPVACWWD